ncbi:Beta-galactosidase 7 [Asimina triloba]
MLQTGLHQLCHHFDNVSVGIGGGPVELIGKNNVVKNLSSNAWKYKVGLNGEKKQIFNDPPAQQLEWNSDHDMPINRPFTWYKTGFKAPLGLEPVVVDLQGLGKGEAWINGHSIGRYWPTVVSPSLGCEECGYRGNYGPSRCETNCGQPTQRWYHVPRSFLQADDNTLVLFEEAGGNPSFVNFQTVTVGTICANVEEGKSVELSCQGGKTISDVEFASFGDPQGACGSFQKGTCDSDQTLALVKKACVGQKGCVVDVSEATLGASNCGENITKRLALKVVDAELLMDACGFKPIWPLRSQYHAVEVLGQMCRFYYLYSDSPLFQNLLQATEDSQILLGRSALVLQASSVSP